MNLRGMLKRISKYLVNFLLLTIVLILIIPSWRVAFQTWYQSLTLTDIEMQANLGESIPEDAKNWAIFNSNQEMINFAELEGQPIVLTFWATWCSACRAEMPSVLDLKERVDSEINFVSVTTESQQTLEDSGLNDAYDFLYCCQEYPDFYDIQYFPTTLVIDKNMRIVFRSQGAGDLDNDKNIKFLEGLLEN